MPRVMPRVSTTSTTGAASSFASAALLSDPSTATPSCSPLFPSIEGEVRARAVAHELRPDLVPPSWCGSRGSGSSGPRPR